MIDLDQAIMADIAAETISRDRVLKLRASQDSFKQSMEKLRGLSYVGFSLPNKDTGAKRREAKLAIDTRFELLSYHQACDAYWSAYCSAELGRV